MNLFLSPKEQANKQPGKCNFSPTLFVFCSQVAFYLFIFFFRSCWAALAEDSVWFSLAPVNFPKIFFNLMVKQRVLIIGHSFVHRLKVFVQKKRHMQAFSSLSGMADIYFHGVGGRTIAKFRKFDFNVVRQLVPDVIILELGSNDLVELSPQTVGSELESLVRELYEIDSVQFVVVGQVLRRHTPNSVEYNFKVGKLHQYLKVVLEPLPFCYYWRHRGFWKSKSELYLPDGVHLNNLGNYKFMSSIRGAVCVHSLVNAVPCSGQLDI